LFFLCSDAYAMLQRLARVRSGAIVGIDHGDASGLGAAAGDLAYSYLNGPPRK
jgi:hypothetical protein